MDLLASDLPRKTSSRRPSDQGQQSPQLPPKEFGRIAQHVKKGEGRKPHLGDHLIKGSYRLNYLQMSSVESHSMSRREKEGNLI